MAEAGKSKKETQQQQPKKAKSIRSVIKTVAGAAGDSNGAVAKNNLTNAVTLFDILQNVRTEGTVPAVSKMSKKDGASSKKSSSSKTTKNPVTEQTRVLKALEKAFLKSNEISKDGFRTLNKTIKEIDKSGNVIKELRQQHRKENIFFDNVLMSFKNVYHSLKTANTEFRGKFLLMKKATTETPIPEEPLGVLQKPKKILGKHTKNKEVQSSYKTYKRFLTKRRSAKKFFSPRRLLNNMGGSILALVGSSVKGAFSAGAKQLIDLTLGKKTQLDDKNKAPTKVESKLDTLIDYVKKISVRLFQDPLEKSEQEREARQKKSSPNMFDKIMDSLDGLKEKTKEKAAGIWDIIGGAFGLIAANLTKSLGGLVSFFGQISSGLLAIGTKIASLALPAIASLGSGIGSLVTAIAPALVPLATIAGIVGGLVVIALELKEAYARLKDISDTNKETQKILDGDEKKLQSERRRIEKDESLTDEQKKNKLEEIKELELNRLINEKTKIISEGIGGPNKRRADELADLKKQQQELAEKIRFRKDREKNGSVLSNSSIMQAARPKMLSTPISPSQQQMNKRDQFNQAINSYDNLMTKFNKGSGAFVNAPTSVANISNNDTNMIAPGLFRSQDNDLLRLGSKR